MALVKCYDPDGNEHQKELVDVRECVEFCGYTLTPPAPVVEAPPAPVPTAPVKAAKAPVQAEVPAAPAAPWQPQA